MCCNCLTRGLVALPLVAVAVAAVALGTTAFDGSADVTAPAVTAVPNEAGTPGLAPTTTSRDWQETAVSVVRPKGGRF